MKSRSKQKFVRTVIISIKNTTNIIRERAISIVSNFNEKYKTKTNCLIEIV